MRSSAEPSRKAFTDAAAARQDVCPSGLAERTAGSIESEPAEESGYSGRVLRIEKTSIHDGEGLRTVVFLAGCPLRCKWCSTPESQGKCGAAGYGKEMTAAQVVREVCKDEIFFFHSGGGVTVSGGEVLLQPDFACRILRSCMEQGIATAIETSLYAEWPAIEKLLPYLTDMYVDFKLYEEAAHRAYTGVSNVRIKENLRRLDKQYRGDIHIRIPTVPGVNMTEENMKQTARFLAENTRIRDVELLPYHRLGLETYRKLNRRYALPDTPPPSMEGMRRMAAVFTEAEPGFRMKIKGEPVRDDQNK